MTSVPYAVHAREDRETRAKSLLAQGYHPGRVAELTGVPLGLVDRWAGLSFDEGERSPMRRAYTAGEHGAGIRAVRRAS